MEKYVLRFFFDYGAGGCLWAGNDLARERLGVGPVDATTYGLDGRVSSKPKVALSSNACLLRDKIDNAHYQYLNPRYQMEPSLWRQVLCDRFNAEIDKLFKLLNNELEDNYTILNQQRRLIEDPELDAYLYNNPDMAHTEELTFELPTRVGRKAVISNF